MIGGGKRRPILGDRVSRAVFAAAADQGRVPTISRMLDAMKALAERSVMERLVLLVNHVIAAEPAAVERLRPHASRTMRIELTGWPALLPALGPFAFRVTPAGLLEWRDDDDDGAAAAPDLRVAVDAANPALLGIRIVAGDRPSITVSGDAAFATDLDWLIDNLRWDLQDDLARIVGDVPARELGRIGGWLAGALREGAKALRNLAARAPNDTAASR
jgi:ubiquinone biosynthesis accessory factor UbiJ